MAGQTNGVFSVPYELAVVRPLRQTTELERQAALASAHYNTELIPQEFIYIDLSTDSGVSARSTAQLALLSAAAVVEPGMGLAWREAVPTTDSPPRFSDILDSITLCRQLRAAQPNGSGLRSM